MIAANPWYRICDADTFRCQLTATLGLADRCQVQRLQVLVTLPGDCPSTQTSSSLRSETFRAGLVLKSECIRI